MLAVIRSHAKNTHENGDNVEYVQGTPAMIGHKVGDILLTKNDKYPQGIEWETITVRVLPEPEQL